MSTEYRADQLLGKNKDGSTPRKPRVEHPRPDTRPMGHDHVRDYETNPGGSLGRDGRVPKHSSAPIHGGMTAQQEKMTGLGHPIAGAPDASSANPLDTEAPGKRLTPPMIKPGMRSRYAESGVNPAGGEPGVHAAVHAALHPAIDEAHRAQGQRVLGEAVEGGGKSNFHPSNLRRR